jgi:hypothetical protein
MQEYSNEDVMVGSWMLGLNVEHTFDSAFCCGDASVCQATGNNLDAAHSLESTQSEDTVENRDCNAYVPGTDQQLTQRFVQVASKVCVTFGGSCNGFCGVEDNEDEYKRHEGCPRVV